MRLSGVILLAFCLQVSARADAQQRPAEDTPADAGRSETIKVRGFVLTEAGVPLAGACVMIKQIKKVTITNEKGAFEFSHGIPAGSVLVISYVGYAPDTLTVTEATQIRIYVKEAHNELDEAVIKTYYRTSSNEIESQPVRDPLAALAGRVPGLIVTTVNPSASTHAPQQHQRLLAHKTLGRRDRLAIPCKNDLGSSASGSNFQISKKRSAGEITTVVLIIIESYKTRLKHPPFSAVLLRDIGDEVMLEVDRKQNFKLLEGKYERSTFNIRVKPTENNPPDPFVKLDVFFDCTIYASNDINTIRELEPGDKNQYFEAIEELNAAVCQDLERYYICRREPTGKIFIGKKVMQKSSL